MSGVNRICLVCNHKERTAEEDNYSEVCVCPRCNGAFVDTFRIGKYLEIRTNQEVQDEASQFVYGGFSKGKSELLLKIEIENESSYPKVFYKGEEIKNVLFAQLNYESGDEDAFPKYSFDIEHHKKGFINNRFGMTKTILPNRKG